MTVAHGTPAVICPEWAFLLEIYLETQNEEKIGNVLISDVQKIILDMNELKWNWCSGCNNGEW